MKGIHETGWRKVHDFAGFCELASSGLIDDTDQRNQSGSVF
jgi:hypothetical protein